MGFIKSDRDMIIETHTIVKAQAKAIEKLQEEDDLLHHRINVVRNMFVAVTAAFGGVVAYFKSGGQ